MTQHEPSTPALVEPCVVVGHVAALLAEGSVPAALAALVEGLGLRTAVVRTSGGAVLGVGGEVLHAVPPKGALAHIEPTVEMAVPGVGTLTTVGARPSRLPALRAVAAVLGLALANRPERSGDALLQAAEDDRDDLADALHDGPVQSLVVARYAADAAVRGGDAVVARDAVQQALVEVRRALWSLRPRGATGLTEALAQLSAQLVATGGPALVVRGRIDAVGAPAALAFRLVQAVALAGAPAVRLGVRADGGDLVVDVDGGAPLAVPERWGLRARALGGNLSYSIGRLRLTLPLNPDARTTT